MNYLIQGILVLFGAFAALEACLTYQNAQSAMHQIYAGTWFIVLAVCIAGIGIIHAISNIKLQNSSEKALPNTVEGLNNEIEQLCPHCSKVILKEAKACQYCNKWLPGHEPTA